MNCSVGLVRPRLLLCFGLKEQQLIFLFFFPSCFLERKLYLSPLASLGAAAVSNRMDKLVLQLVRQHANINPWLFEPPNVLGG
jgi:hypothetical protein